MSMLINIKTIDRSPCSTASWGYCLDVQGVVARSCPLFDESRWQMTKDAVLFLFVLTMPVGKRGSKVKSEKFKYQNSVKL